MQCQDVIERLSAWVDGELSAVEAKSMDQHIGHCPACAREAEDLKKLASYLDSLPPVTAPDLLARRTLRAFRDALDRPSLAEWWADLSVAMRSAACGVALAGMVCGMVLAISLTVWPESAPVHPYFQSVYTVGGLLP